jgi:hypothetical protein
MLILSALIPVTLGLGYFVLEQNLEWFLLIPVSISLIVSIAGLIQGIILLRYELYVHIDPAYMIETYYSKSTNFLINKTASSSASAVNQNIDILNRKTIG